MRFPLLKNIFLSHLSMMQKSAPVPKFGPCFIDEYNALSGLEHSTIIGHYVTWQNLKEKIYEDRILIISTIFSSVSPSEAVV